MEKVCCWMQSALCCGVWELWRRMVASTWLQVLLVGTSCLAIGYLIGKRGARYYKPDSPSSITEFDYDGKKQRHEADHMAETMDDFKMVLVVRNDLKMGKGKIAAQCSHATLGLYKKIFHRAPMALKRWEMCGQVKVVTKVESEGEMLALQAKAKNLKLASHITIDAGKTQIAPNSRTVMSLLEQCFLLAGRSLTKSMLHLRTRELPLKDRAILSMT